jgi:hypothetical protein
MLRNHRFFIRLADQHAHGIARAANLRAVGGIGIRIQIDAEKAEPRADACANTMRILTNAGGEHQGVYAADGSGQRANFAADAKGEVIQSGFGGSLVPAASMARTSCDTPDMPFKPLS